MDLAAKNASEIPMDVFLPAGCDAVRPTVSGTDCDGIRNVGQTTAIHEAKELGVSMQDAQLFAFKRLNPQFIVISHWHYESAAEHGIRHPGGYPRFAVPARAAIYPGTNRCRDWLDSYLGNCRFDFNIGNQGERVVHFTDVNETIKQYRFEATPEWKYIAWIPDHFESFRITGKQTFPDLCFF